MLLEQVLIQNVDRETFETILEEIVEKMTAPSILAIEGARQALSDYLNEDVLREVEARGRLEIDALKLRLDAIDYELEEDVEIEHQTVPMRVTHTGPDATSHHPSDLKELNKIVDDLEIVAKWREALAILCFKVVYDPHSDGDPCLFIRQEDELGNIDRQWSSRDAWGFEIAAKEVLDLYHPRPGRDIVRIQSGGKVYRGPIDTVCNNSNWPHKPNWDVQFHHDERSAAKTGDPGRYKQDPDGGTVRFRPNREP